MPPRENRRRVTTGAWVTVRGPKSRETQRYRLVDDDALNVSGNEIPTSSPFAKAILGKSPGDVVKYSAPGGVMTVEIVDVRLGI